MPITLDWYTASWHSVPGAAVARGPLTFCLPVDEEWVYIGKGKPGPGNLDEEWNVVPTKSALWNVALELDVNDPDRSLTLVDLGAPRKSLPWRHAPIGLRAKARVLPDWQTDTVNSKPQTPALPEPPLRVEKRSRTVTLVPFAFTHIRMTYLPVMGVEKREDTLVSEGKAQE